MKKVAEELREARCDRFLDALSAYRRARSDSHWKRLKIAAANYAEVAAPEAQDKIIEIMEKEKPKVKPKKAAN